jgi:DNA-binding transcriptional MocR family regulator
MFSIDHESETSLVTQIVNGVTGLVEAQNLRPGVKMPSIRQFANTHRVSLFTVVEAYDRLVAQGVLLSRPNAGFYVRRRSLSRADDEDEADRRYHFDSSWYLRSIFESHRLRMRPGCGWLPGGWLFNDGLQRALRRLASSSIDTSGYGDPKGYMPLRKLVSQSLVNREIAVNEEQVLLTQGSSQALDLVARRLVRPGDVVLVDDPGYANLMYVLRFIGATLVGVPRTPEGYDLAALEAAICEHRPKVMFTQPRLQSPTGSSAQSGHLHRLLQLAEKHDLLIVENDIYAELDPEQRPSLASLDQISRVVHIGSFSKTLSPNLRVGFLVAPADLVGDLSQLKMIAGLTTSEISERIAHLSATDARWRRHLKSIRDRLTSEHERVAGKLIGMGFELFTEAKSGLFLWARHPACPDSSALSERAAQHDIMLGPGHLFTPGGESSPWLRFNVSYCEDDALFAFLAGELSRH